jgi:glutamate racemase
MSQHPIGIFDSGVGGLTVAREVCRALPSEAVLYVADTEHCPYGDKPLEEVRERALAIGRWLQAEGAKAVVVACNTASGAALEQLREELAIPVVGLEPAVKTGAAVTRNGKVGVMATSGTLRSERFARLLKNHAQGIEVRAQPCPGLADLIEDGHLDDPALHAMLERFAAPLVAAGVDTVVLGCTHYPFVREPIARALGPSVQLVDSAPAIARRVRQVLAERGALASNGGGRFRLLTTAAPEEVQDVVHRLWSSPLAVERLAV